MTTATVSVTDDLLERARAVAQNLRGEGRDGDADVVVQLVQALDAEPATHYTTGQVATKLGVTRQTIVNWVKNGTLKGTRLGGRIMISKEALRKYDDILRTLELLDQEAPDISDEEINRLVSEGRKDWTWVGRES